MTAPVDGSMDTMMCCGATAYTARSCDGCGGCGVASLVGVAAAASVGMCSKGDQFLSKGLKAENIVRKNKPGRKAFKKPEAKSVPKAAPKAAPKPKAAAPKITKVAPMKPGE